MDKSLNQRQNKFRQSMKEEGKSQRSFFLTEEAMEAIYQHKEKINAPNLNYALEHILTSLSAMVAEAEDQTIMDKVQADKQNEIVEQAKRVSDAYRQSEFTWSNEDGKVWGAESRKLAMLIDPSSPIPKKPLP